MAGSIPSPSLRQRVRYLTTATCLGLVAIGAWGLAHEQTAHGGLALAAALMLWQGSLWGRKARRRHQALTSTTTRPRT